MSAQPEALRLAKHIHALFVSEWGVRSPMAKDSKIVLEELRRLSIENEALGLHLSERMKDLARVEAQRDALLEALKEITPSMPPVDAPCHYGIVPQEKCGHCGRIAKARAAIKAVEEEA